MLDPDVILDEMRDLRALSAEAAAAAAKLDTGDRASDLREEADDLLVTVAGKFAELDEWLSRGGCLPGAWSTAKPA